MTTLTPEVISELEQLLEDCKDKVFNIYLGADLQSKALDNLPALLAAARERDELKAKLAVAVEALKNIQKQEHDTIKAIEVVGWNKWIAKTAIAKIGESV